MKKKNTSPFNNRELCYLVTALIFAEQLGPTTTNEDRKIYRQLKKKMLLLLTQI